jgi:hypothetical protein
VFPHTRHRGREGKKWSECRGAHYYEGGGIIDRKRVEIVESIGGRRSIRSRDDVEMGIQKGLSSIYMVQAIEARARAREGETIEPA